MHQINHTLDTMGVGAAPKPGPRLYRYERTIVKTPGESKAARRLARNAAKRERRMVCMALDE